MNLSESSRKDKQEKQGKEKFRMLMCGGRFLCGNLRALTNKLWEKVFGHDGTMKSSKWLFAKSTHCHRHLLNNSHKLTYFNFNMSTNCSFGSSNKNVLNSVTDEIISHRNSTGKTGCFLFLIYHALLHFISGQIWSRMATNGGKQTEGITSVSSFSHSFSTSPRFIYMSSK